MNFDDQIRRYFGASNLSGPTGSSGDWHRTHEGRPGSYQRSRRAVRSLGTAAHAQTNPDLEVVFETEADREAARNFMDLIQGAGGA